ESIIFRKPISGKNARETLPTSATFLYNNTNICEINLKKLDD
ncbi:21014_t:CDS:2, partial [Rhizophagus irregularis]